MKALHSIRYMMANPREREQMLSNWSESGNTSLIPLMSNALNDRTVPVRKAAAKALRRFKDERVVNALSEATNDSETEVRVEVILSLGECGDPKAVDTLVPLLKDKNVSVRSAAANALRSLKWRPA